MSTTAFQANTQFEIEGKTFRLIRKLEADLWQAEEFRTKRIHEFQERDLQALYVQRKLCFISSDKAALASSKKLITVASYSEQQWEAAKIRRAYVLATLDLPNSVSRLIPVINETWGKLRNPEKAPHAITVIRWKNNFLKAGRDMTVLIEQNGKKGNSEPRYPKEVENFVQQALDSVYLRQERGTIQDTLERATALVIQENELRPISIHLPWPTRRLVKRMIDAIPAFDRYAARHGRVAATKRFRSVLAHRITQGPLERAEIDHTLLDLMVIDDRSGLPLGRPWVTACIDDYSRCILGVYVGFEPPSHYTVARCLKQAFLPKVSIHEDYPAIVNEWQAHGVMQELVVDNGTEFHSTSLENACYSLGIEIHYSARKTPWFKGKIERFLGTMNRAIAHGNPGTTFQNIFDKEEYDPSKHAIVRYSVLQEIVHTWIVDVYHQQVHRTLGVAPAVQWARSISPDEILVPDDPARLDAILGRSEERRLTHKGIELYGLLYNAPALTALRRKHGNVLNVEIRVDTADLGQIVVFSPDKHQMFTVPAINLEYAAGLSEWQHRVCKRFASRELDQYSPVAWLKAKARIADLIDKEFMHKKQRTRAKIARYKGDSMLMTEEQAPPVSGAPEETAILSTPSTVPAPELPACPPPPANNAEPITPKKKFKPVYRERQRQFGELADEEV